MAHILLVDDDQDIQKLGRELLSQSGHAVSLASTATEALDILRAPSQINGPVDLILTDVNMPYISGFEMVEEIRSDAKLRDHAVAFLTGRRERADIERAVGLGVRDYIVKPLDPLLFLQKIKDLTFSSRKLDLVSDARSGSPVGTEVVAPPAPDFATTSLRWTAKASSEIEIISLSEIGLSIRATNPFQHGSKIWLETDLFSKIGIEAPYMKVVACQPTSSGSFETRITFFGLNESSLSKIRAWVQKEVVKNAYSAR